MNWGTAKEGLCFVRSFVRSFVRASFVPALTLAASPLAWAFPVSFLPAPAGDSSVTWVAGMSEDDLFETLAAKEPTGPGSPVRRVAPVEELLGEEPWTGPAWKPTPVVPPGLSTPPKLKNAVETLGGSATPASAPLGPGAPPSTDPCTDPPYVTDVGACQYAPSDPNMAIVCQHPTVYPVAVFVVDAPPTTTTIDIATHDLALLPGRNQQPDTVLRLLRCADATCSRGVVVEIDDDGNTATSCPNDSHIWRVIQPTIGYTNRYLVVVQAAYPGTAGIATVDISLGGTLYESRRVVFGGAAFSHVFAASNDALMVGHEPRADQETFPSADTGLWYFNAWFPSHDCTQDCGDFLYDDDYGSDPSYALPLSRIDVPNAFPPPTQTWGGEVLAAPLDIGRAAVGLRVLWYRRSTTQGGTWTGADQHDEDADGLTLELERILGTCDNRLTVHDIPNVLVRGFDCEQTEAFINGFRANYPDDDPGNCQPNHDDQSDYCWQALDSDHDGIPDLWEVFGGAVRCEHDATPPFYDLGQCTRWLGMEALDDFCTSGTCRSLPVSALSDPDPDSYDIYYLDLPSRCVGPLCNQTHGDPNSWGNDHAIRPAQLDALAFPWTTHPGRCWDGSLLPCALEALGDRRYRVQLHVKELDFADVQDCNPGWGIPFGSDGVRSWYQVRLPLPWRQLGFARFGYAGHGKGGGQAPRGANYLAWGNLWWLPAPNAANGVVETAGVLTHELGHTFGLYHANQSSPTGPQTDCQVRDTVGGGLCPRAEGPMCGGQCRQFVNPVLPSVMAYGYKSFTNGFLNFSAELPSVGSCSACSIAHARFSKGINPAIDEQGVQELYPDAARSYKLIQEVVCLFDGSTGYDPNCPGGCAAYEIHFACDGAQCWVDWDRDDQQDAAPYAFDITYGRYDSLQMCPAQGGPCPACTSDLVEDRDEWAWMLAFGKDALPITVRASRSSDAFYTFAIYQDPFNSDTAANHAGWNLTSTNGAEFAEHNSDVNFCASDADCSPGATCVFDTCTTDGDCAQGQTCVDGACTCTSNSDCGAGGLCNPLSGQCIVDLYVQACGADTDCAPGQTCANGTCTCASDADCTVGTCQGGLCRHPFGRCTCTVDADCVGPTQCTAGLCEGTLAFNKEVEAGKFLAPFNALTLTNDAAEGLHVLSPSTGSPMLGWRHERHDLVIFEFRYDGRRAGQTQARLYESPNLLVWLEFPAGADGPVRLAAAPAGAARPLVHPVPLIPTLWYRVYAELEYKNGGNRLSLRLELPDPKTENYLTPGDIPACVYRNYAATAFGAGDFSLGYSPSDPTKTLLGAIDNATVADAPLDGARAWTNTCVEQP